MSSLPFINRRTLPATLAALLVAGCAAGERAQLADVPGRGAEPPWWERVEPSPSYDEPSAGPVPAVLVAPADVLFPSGSTELSSSADPALDDLACQLAGSDDPVVLSAHTDQVGDAQDNELLSQQRAQAVADALARRGIDAQRLTLEWWGEQRPVADEAGPDPDQARALNRRVEVAAVVAEGGGCG